MTDKIPIGKYRVVWGDGGVHHNYIQIKFREDKTIKIKDGDIITLDMIEPYESEAVRKVTEYLRGLDSIIENKRLNNYYTEHARKIVKLVHEAEDADE